MQVGEGCWLLFSLSLFPSLPPSLCSSLPLLSYMVSVEIWQYMVTSLCWLGREC